MPSGIEDGDQVGVVEGADRPGLDLETTEPVRIGGGIRGQDLDRHLTPEPLIARTVDLTHTP